MQNCTLIRRIITIVCFMMISGSVIAEEDIDQVEVNILEKVEELSSLNEGLIENGCFELPPEEALVENLSTDQLRVLNKLSSTTNLMNFSILAQEDVESLTTLYGELLELIVSSEHKPETASEQRSYSYLYTKIGHYDKCLMAIDKMQVVINDLGNSAGGDNYSYSELPVEIDVANIKFLKMKKQMEESNAKLKYILSVREQDELIKFLNSESLERSTFIIRGYIFTEYDNIKDMLLFAEVDKLIFYAESGQIISFNEEVESVIGFKLDDKDLGTPHISFQLPQKVLFCFEGNEFCDERPITLQTSSGIVATNLGEDVVFIDSNTKDAIAVPRYEIVKLKEDLNCKIVSSIKFNAHRGLIYASTGMWTVVGGLGESVYNFGKFLKNEVYDPFGDESVRYYMSDYSDYNYNFTKGMAMYGREELRKIDDREDQIYELALSEELIPDKRFTDAILEYVSTLKTSEKPLECFSR